MSDDEDNVRTMRHSSSTIKRKSIESDDDEISDSTDPQSAVNDSDEHSEQSCVVLSDSSTSSKDVTDHSRTRSKPQARGPPGRFVKDTYESQKERFLQENQSGDSSLEEWIVSDGELTSEDSGTEGSLSSDDTIVEVSDDNVDDMPNEDFKQEVCQKLSKESDDENCITPSKKLKSQVIHSDDSEPDETSSHDSNTESLPLENNRKRKKLTRVRMLPDSQEVNVQSDDYEDEATEEISDTDSSDESMSGFIVDDTDTVEGEDPQEDYFYTQSIDQQQAFKVVVESMVLRALNPDHFEEEAFRNDQDIAIAFKKIFDSLDLLIDGMKSPAWCKEFVEGLQLTEMSSYKSGNSSGNGCEACRIKDRYALYDVKFYGYKYDRRSLKPMDAHRNVESDDDALENLYTKGFHIGKDCEERARLYHEALHYKRSLLDTCEEKVGRREYAEKSADFIVEELIINNCEWIDDQYSIYKTILDETRDWIRKRSNMS